MSGGREVDLIDEAHGLLAALHSPLLNGFLELWPAAGRRTAPADTAGAPIPGLRHLSEASARAAPFCTPFAATLVAAAHTLSWRRSYTEALVGADFWDNYGWAEFVGLTGFAPSERLACGLMLLGPRVSYPLHHHEAEEIYVPLSGAAHWKLGAYPWEALPPGSVIHHPSNESHAMRTDSTPLLALYLWRSENLAQKSRLDGT